MRQRREFPAGAVVCRRGHLLQSDLMPGGTPLMSACPRCGGGALAACARCGHRIRSDAWTAEAVGEPATYFCDLCSAPFPWIGPEQRLLALENILIELQLSPTEAEAVREELERLQHDMDAVAGDVKRWKRFRELSPRFFNAAAPVVGQILTAETKHLLGLPP